MCDVDNSILPNLKYNFHDAQLDTVKIGPRREITLFVTLYPIYYPGAPQVQVRFGEISNFAAVSKFFNQMTTGVDEEDSLERINALRYDQRKKSTANRLFFYCALDWAGEIKVHCAKLDVTDIPDEAANNMKWPI